MKRRRLPDGHSFQRLIIYASSRHLLGIVFIMAVYFLTLPAARLDCSDASTEDHPLFVVPEKLD